MRTCPDCGKLLVDKYTYCDPCREKRRTKARSYYTEHKKEIRVTREKTKSHRALVSRKLRRERRIAVLTLLGGKCVHCGYSDPRALQIDHINGNGRKEMREGNNSSRVYYYKRILNIQGKGYQILCSNCNWIKKYENKEGYRILI